MCGQCSFMEDVEDDLEEKLKKESKLHINNHEELKSFFEKYVKYYCHDFKVKWRKDSKDSDYKIVTIKDYGYEDYHEFLYDFLDSFRDNNFFVSYINYYENYKNDVKSLFKYIENKSI